MKKITTLQDEANRISNIAEKRAYEFVLKYLLTLNRQISIIAKNQGYAEANKKISDISGIKELYFQIYNKSGWYYANLQHTQIIKQKRLSISFYSKIWNDVIKRHLSSSEITARIKDVTDNIKDEFRLLLQKANLNNFTTQEISKLFQENIPILKNRALRIARTEMTHASSLGAEFAADSITGLKLYSVWIHNKVGNFRETHLAINGNYVEKGKDFNVNGYKMKYPGDPRGGAGEIINCRCRLSYLTEDALREFGLWKS